jgi:putative NIF3 family GTP cyclohydrolase 1 type 2
VVSFADLEAFLSTFLLAHAFQDDQNGVYRPSSGTIVRPGTVARLGMALEPWPGISDWVAQRKLDALFLHRPWKLGALPEGVGVLAHHHAFDERLTTGYNPLLAEALEFSEVEVLGYKEGRPLGMIGNVPRTSVAAFRARVEAAFGGLTGVCGAQTGEVTRACVVGAMRPAFVREAAERGAQVYLTGQFRRSAAQAVVETGMTILEIGHERGEVWGLRTLSVALQERFPDLVVVLPTKVEGATEKMPSGA